MAVIILWVLAALVYAGFSIAFGYDQRTVMEIAVSLVVAPVIPIVVFALFNQQGMLDKLERIYVWPLQKIPPHNGHDN